MVNIEDEEGVFSSLFITAVVVATKLYGRSNERFISALNKQTAVLMVWQQAANRIYIMDAVRLVKAAKNLYTSR